MPLQLTVIVVGAGIGGLAAAVALRQAGHKAIVLEKHSNKREVGFAVTISPNAARVLQNLAFDFNRARVVRCTKDAIIQAPPAQYPFQVTLGKTFDGLEKQYGVPWMTVHRMDLWSELRDLAINQEGAGVPVEIREGVSAIDFDPSGSVVLRDGNVLKANIVVAADGVKSIAYKAVVADGKDRPATFTGVSNVRFCVPTESLMGDQKLSKYIGVAANGVTTTVGAEQDRLILRYPCRDGLLQNFGFYAKVDDNLGIDQVSKTRIMKQDALDRIQGFHPSLHRLLDHCNEDDLYLWNCVDRDALPTYHNDSLIIVGDAAHPMLPTLGSGAGMAIEDAGVLGMVLEAVLNEREVTGRLKLWDSLRRPRANAVQLLSRTISVSYEISSEIKAGVRKYLSEEELPDFTRPYVNRMLWSYDCLEATKKAMLDRRDSPVE